MDAFALATQQADVQNAKDKVAQVRSACMVIQAKVAELVTLRANWQALVASGVYAQKDVDALNVQAVSSKLAAINTAAGTYLVS